MTDTTNPKPTLASLKDLRATAPIRRRRRLWPWVLVLLVAAGAAAMALAPRTQEVQASAVMSAYPSARFAQLNASGYVVAQRRASVASKATGRVVELKVREGSVLKAGELIARLDDADVRAAIAQAEAAIAQAEAGQRQAEAQVRQAQVELGNAEAEWGRQQGLQAQGFISPQALDAVRRRVDSARAALAAAQAGVAQAQASQAQARAQMRVQQVARDNTEVRAPFDGVVLVKNANVGDMITPFSSASGTSGAVVTMADLGTLEVEADVAEANVGKVRIDQPVEITLDALPDARFRGSVVRIVPTVDRAKATVMTKVRFDRLDERILPEMSAKVAFLSQAPGPDDARPVTAVNPKTVVERDGRKLVFRIQGDQVEAVPVTPGRTLGDLLEIPGDTLKPGQRLVLSPGDKLAGGAKVVVGGR
ncbi:MAG: efflux RND transporter periplasmic adaptor subunit [Rubrivivax sp.]|nr:efflux RND transporter periplasmic adaptor subunit [Rubrivivax sp.]